MKKRRLALRAELAVVLVLGLVAATPLLAQKMVLVPGGSFTMGDAVAEELNISRQAVIKSYLRQALDQHYQAKHKVKS